MGHNAYDTQQSLYCVNVYVLKNHKRSNTSYKIGFYLLKLIKNLDFVLEIKASTFEL
jgi:hypothetical protein